MPKALILDAPNVPQVLGSNTTNKEVARILETVFETPTPFMQEVISRFRHMAENESGEDEIEGQPVPIPCRCSVCGSKLDLTIGPEGGS